MKLLIIDDDSLQRERYHDGIEDYCRKRKMEIIPEYCKNLQEGLERLDKDYDGAVVDLRLSSGKPQAEGNEIVKRIKRSKRFPVYVLTGYPADLDVDLQEDIRTGAGLFFKVDKRDKPFAEVLDFLATIYHSGIFQVLGSNGIIESALNEIFWSHLSKSLAFWGTQPHEDIQMRKHRILRYALSHLSQKLDFNDQDVADHYYPDEMYIIPGLRKEWQTGDIVRDGGGKCYVVVTPACDLENKKAERIQTAEIEQIDAKIPKDKLLNIIKNSGPNKYHFLPPSQGFGGGVINFQKIQSHITAEFPQRFAKVGSLSEKFVKDIVARFSSYYARQGQPSFDTAKLFDAIITTKSA